MAVKSLPAAVVLTSAALALMAGLGGIQLTAKGQTTTDPSTPVGIQAESSSEAALERLTREYHVSRLKHMIMSQLGLDTPSTNVTTRPSEIDPKAIEDYNILSTLTKATEKKHKPVSVMTLHSFRGTLQRVDDYFNRFHCVEQSYQAKFPFKWPQRGKIEKIELFLYHNPSLDQQEFTRTVLISEIQDQNCSKPMKFPITATSVTARTGYGRYDITGNMGEWLEKYVPSENKTIHLGIMVYKTNGFRQYNSDELKVNTNNTQEIPRLVLFVRHPKSASSSNASSSSTPVPPSSLSSQEEKSRRKRQSNATEMQPKYCREGEYGCCLKKIVVSMAEIGLGFITLPETVTTGYCEGSCRPGDLKGMPNFYYSNPCCAVNDTMDLPVTNYLGHSHMLKNVIPLDCQCF